MLRKLEFRYTTIRKGGSKCGSSDDAYKMHVVITTPETCMAADSKTATGRLRRELSSIQVCASTYVLYYDPLHLHILIIIA